MELLFYWKCDDHLLELGLLHLKTKRAFQVNKSWGLKPQKKVQHQEQLLICGCLHGQSSKLLQTANFLSGLPSGNQLHGLLENPQINRLVSPKGPLVRGFRSQPRLTTGGQIPLNMPLNIHHYQSFTIVKHHFPIHLNQLRMLNYDIPLGTNHLRI